MKFHPIYEAVLEGRYHLPIELTEGTTEAGDTLYEARYEDIHGVIVRTTDASRSEAHRRCTDAVLTSIRDGRITPTR